MIGSKWARLWGIVCGIGMGLGARAGAAVGIEPMVGANAKYIVRKGDTLLKIARRNNLTLSVLAQANRGKGRRVRPGQTVILPSLYILPRNPQDGIVINVPERQVYLFEGGALRAHYPVCVGKPDPKWQTALGTFKLVEKKTNPTWRPTKSIVESSGIKDEPVPPGQENPLGDRWMGWSKPGFGFHSTIAPQSIGTASSHGCVRLYPESAHAMYDRVKTGMTIYAVYEPVKIGKSNGKLFLSVFPDIYHQGVASVPHVQKILQQFGLLAFTDDVNLRRIIGNQSGVPQVLLGTDQKIKVNGKVVALPLAPISVRGSWVVPAKEMTGALGGQVASAGKNSITVTCKGHSLLLTEGTKRAKLDGKPITLPIAPGRIQSVLVAPLAPLAQVCGAALTHPKGQAIALNVKG